jgi:hypothetical protein
VVDDEKEALRFHRPGGVTVVVGVARCLSTIGKRLRHFHAFLERKAPDEQEASANLTR